MLPENRISSHPGEILLEEFLKPRGITQAEFAQAPDTTLRFRLTLQNAYDLTHSRLGNNIVSV